eukprot:COSAG05_NODE_4126_length_1662_cov_0.937300_2_plen_310_part_01
MKNAGFPATEAGKGNWGGAVYIKSNGQTNPSIYVNEFGQTRQEYESELALFYDFKKISAVEGKEEQDIRDAHKQHRDRYLAFMESKTQRQLLQTKLKMEKDKLVSVKNKYKADAETCANLPSFVEDNIEALAKQLFPEMKNKTHNKPGAVKTLLSYMLAKEQQSEEEEKIKLKETEENNLITEVRNIEDRETEERNLMDDVAKTMVDRNKKRKDPTIAAADLPVWNKKQKLVRQNSLAQMTPEEKRELLKKIKESILKKLKEKSKDVVDAPSVFDKDKDGVIEEAEFVGVVVRNFSFSSTDGKAAYREIP